VTGYNSGTAGGSRPRGTDLGHVERLRFDDRLVFRNLGDGKVLDADAKSVNNNGGKVQLWDWWGGVNQIWQG